MQIVFLIIVFCVVLIALYRLHYQREFDKALTKHIQASKEGKRPLLMVGALWFTFYEDYDLSHLSYEVRETIKFAGVVAMGGVPVTYYTRTIPDDLY